jgi:hypothetical protein
MSLTDLRKRTKIRSQSQEIGDDIINPDLKGDVERLFDRPNFVSDVQALLDEEKLGGTKVLTIDQDLSPVSNVRHVVRPALRQKIETMVREGDGDFEIRPDPDVQVITTVGFPGVRVAPQGTRSATIEYVPGPRGQKNATEGVLPDIQDGASEQDYILIVDGIRYPVLDVDGTVLELGRAPEFSSSRHGLLYNGADRFLIVTTRTESPEGDSVEERQGKDEVRNLQENPIPLLKSRTLPGKHDISLISKNDQSRSEYRAQGVSFNVDRPPQPGIGEVFYTFGRPERDAPGKNRLNSSLTKLGVAASVDHPGEDTSVIIGARCRVGTKSSGDWKYGDTQFARVRPEAIKWQIASAGENEGDTIGVVFALGQHKPGHRRRVDVKFLDEMGRVIKREVATKEAVNPLESGLTVHESLPDRFSKFVEGASVPLRTDVSSFYDDADAQIEDLKAKAESIIQDKTVDEIPVERLEAPNPRLDLEAVGGRQVAAKATRSAHPNSLSIKYRFAWDGGDQFGAYGGPVRVYDFEESGERPVTLEVKGETGKTNRITETIILPKPVLSFDFASVNGSNANRTVNIGTSASILDDGTVADYRFAYKIWDDETQYSSGETVYYEPNETIYVANTTTTIGLDPPDGSEWDEVVFGSSTNNDYYEYASDDSGEKTVVVQAQDNRGAFGQSTGTFYIPDLAVNFEIEDGDVIIREDSAPDDYDLLYEIDWNNDGSFTVGPTTLPVGKAYSSVAGNNIVIRAIAPAGASDQTQITIPDLDVSFSVSPTGSGREYTLDASGSTFVNGDDTTLEFRFDAEGDGEWDGDFSSTASINHVFSGKGILSPRVEVREPGLGISQVASQNALVYDLSPQISNGDVVTIQPDVVEEGLEGEVFQYNYNWEGTYTGWVEQGRKSHTYSSIGSTGASRDVSVKIRRPNQPGSTEYTVSQTIYWPDAPSLSVTKDGLVVGLSYTANAPTGAPFSDSDLELQIDLGSGETTTPFQPIGQMPGTYTYSSEGAYSWTLRARAPNGAVNLVTGNIDVGVDLDLPDFGGGTDTGFI